MRGPMPAYCSRTPALLVRVLKVAATATVPRALVGGVLAAVLALLSATRLVEREAIGWQSMQSARCF